MASTSCNRPENCKLRNQYGTILCALTKAEAKSLVNQGKATRVGAFTYRLIEAPPPSDSRESPCMLTRGDMQMLAAHGCGQKIPVPCFERLAGWGLISTSQMA
jgi:hypothetical protein